MSVGKYAVFDERYAALRADHAVERELIDEFRTLAEILLEHFGGPAEGRRRLGFVNRNVVRSELSIVDSTEVDEVASDRDHRDRQMEALEDAELFEFSTQHFDSDSHRLERGD